MQAPGPLVTHPNKPFTVMCSVTSPLGRSEAGVDLVLIQTALLSRVNHVVILTSLHLHEKDREVCIKTRSPPASLLFKGQVTQHTTVKWSVVACFKHEMAKCDNSTVIDEGSSCTYCRGILDL